MIYFSFIGNHDSINSDSKEYGAFINIFNEYQKEINRIFLFVTPSTGIVNYNKIASDNIEQIRKLKPKIEIEIIKFNIPNPVDYDIVYPILLDKVLEIVEKNKIKKERSIINITSGTPTMTACWVLLSQSGIIPNATPVQSFQSKFSRKGKTTEEVNFNIDDFPKITAPSSMKRQITILSREKENLEEKLEIEKLKQELPSIIGESKKILEIKDQILNDINQKTHVLIIGERGTGKEIVAKAIWEKYHSEKDEILNTIDCSGIPTELATSELFGHVKGAFTGAVEDKKGIIEEYKGKILFLDEIGNLSLEAQSKLLRVLTHGEFRKVGSTKPSKIEIQIIAATNKDVSDDNIFAQDIKDRFHEIINLPPLRERKEDINFLVNYFINLNSKLNSIQNPVILDQKIVDVLVDYNWPGNIRDLENFISRLLRRFNSGGKINYKDLPKRFIESILADDKIDVFLPPLPLLIPLPEYSHKIIEKARAIAKTHSEVDQLLKQHVGTERQRNHKEKNKNK
ncbi:MAG: sigma 54-interacting transcriptional regulator [Ignavibacteriae bacterium]|nr:sigma 54-interacting transcriptional regulator [Ignavibacteriota bacterium]